jgi:hypothetical protein
MNEGTVYWNLKRFGAPLGNCGKPGRYLSLDETLARAVELARHHPAVAQVWPVVFSKNRKLVKVGNVERLSEKLGQTKALGFLVSVTRRLLGDQRLRGVEKRLRRKASRKTENFFLDFNDEVYQRLVEQRTPKEAKAWSLRMNTQFDDFESCFKKFCP